MSVGSERALASPVAALVGLEWVDRKQAEEQ